ncbi:UDP-N-acetylmuramate dehydrogenase [Marinomonas ostreistagni]|uniref:UDP-N-acetylmuramate dehydrogenase n=1 Tax=Marinomonas ostreistagni TaxID=359209 RepID=UPI00194E294C|nr:UDP-N-acetylmuramate dehydrogenase [Marinomonas ostreistagni]MBM6549991.1 UDP-N-acetylmuramate dehydrogenase [Marinomonas ostreistagni]
MSNLPQEVEVQASLYSYNTFRFDYNAEYLARVESREQLLEAVTWANDHNLPITCLGGGSNLLLQGNVSGLVIVNRLQGCQILDHATHVSVRFGAGMNWHECVSWAVEQGLWGIENLALIPGTAGAAPVQNIGAYGVEIKDVLESVTALDRETGEFVTILAHECGFDYRESHFKHAWKERYIIVDICLRLTKEGQPKLAYGGLNKFLSQNASISEVFDTVCQVRQSKLPNPDVLANAGSFFKNPIVTATQYAELKQRFPDLVAFAHGDGWKLAAGWLNDKAGWKGHRQGNVGVYDKQALVLVNYADRRADGLCQLEADIKQSIYATFGVSLEREPVLLGAPSCQ